MASARCTRRRGRCRRPSSAGRAGLLPVRFGGSRGRRCGTGWAGRARGSSGLSGGRLWGGGSEEGRGGGAAGVSALDQAYGRPPVSIEGGDQPVAIVLGSLLQRARE